MQRNRYYRYIQRKKQIRNRNLIISLVVIFFILYFVVSFFSDSDIEILSKSIKDNKGDNFIEDKAELSVYGLIEEENPVPKPEIVIDHLPINEFSRPGILVNSIEHVVIHYVGNPMTTAQQNRSYYEQIIATMETSVSSNYVVGLDGEIIECVPSYEVAYASNNMNRYSVSIEASHEDESGSFNTETYHAMVELTAWLCGRYGLTSDDLLRHYDITGKECPKSFVDNPQEWDSFKRDVQKFLDRYI